MTEHDITILKRLEYQVKEERRGLTVGESLWLIDKLKPYTGILVKSDEKTELIGAKRP